MTLHVAMASSALVAAALLLFFSTSRIAAGVATVAAALELAMALGLVRVQVASFPLGLVFPLGLAVPGLICWLRATTKPAASASAIVAFVGVLQIGIYLTSHTS